jgi:hypothetical protein
MKKMIKESNYLYSIDENGVITKSSTGKIMKSKLAQFLLNDGTKKCMTRNSLLNKYFPEKAVVNNKYSRSIKEKKLVSRFKGIKKRCYDKNDSGYKNYGGRGIKIFDEWLADMNSFIAYCINNGFEENLSIDRIDNSKGYFPGNIRFVDSFVQNNNTRSNIILHYHNKKYTLSQFCRKFNIPYKKAWSVYKKYNRNADDFIENIFKKKHIYTSSINGEELTLSEISKKYNVDIVNVRSRYKRGKRGFELIKPINWHKILNTNKYIKNGTTIY